MRNLYPGTCAVCRSPVDVKKGEYDPATRKVTCDACGGVRAEAAPRVRVSRTPNGIAFKPTAFLGGDLFTKYRTALTGSRFIPEDKSNAASLDKAAGIVAALSAAGFVVDLPADIASTLQALRAEQRTMVFNATERATETDKKLQERGLVLFPFQKTGIRWLASRFGALLADEMGLGKTIQVVVALPENAAVVVVCVAVAKGVWAREIARWRPDLTPVILEGRGSFRWPLPGEVIITNFDILPPPPAKTPAGTTVVMQEAAGGILVQPSVTEPTKKAIKQLEGEPAQNTVLVGDEVHAIKSSKSKRTQSFREISHRVRGRSGRVWLTTGTPLLNKPGELWCILQAADIAREAFGSWNEFKAAFRGQDGEWGGVEWGEPDEEAIVPKLRRVTLRRMREDVLPELPTKMWQRIPVDLAAKDRKAIDKACAYIIKLLPSSWDRVLSDDDPFEGSGGEKPMFKTKDIEAARELMLSTSASTFAAMSNGRKLLAMAKIPAMLAVVEEFEEQEEPLIVFSAHRAPIDLFADRPGWAVITGDTPNAERTRIEDAFQAGKLKGVAGTIKAMGVSITLTHSHHELFVDREYVPGLNDQAEDRACRIGQTRGVVIHDLVCNHPLDRALYEILATKTKIINASVNAAAVTDGEVEPYELPQVDFDRLRALAEKEAAAADEAERLARVRRQWAEGEQARFNSERQRAQAEGRVVAAEFLTVGRRAPKNAREEWALRALITLNRLDPDRANSRNDVGFNGADTGYGHHLGGRMFEGLTDSEWAASAAMCTKYWRQVGRPPETT